VSEEVLEIFTHYPWPGNIRELEHVIEHAFVLCNDRLIRPEHLPPYMSLRAREAHSTDPDREFPQTILNILDKTDWNISKAARDLGMSRPTLYKKIRDLKLKKK
jgi:transcriptional regulator of acetoin/glycerol metabolism